MLCQGRRTAVWTLSLLALFINFIISSITLLTIQHQGMKSTLRLQKSMTTCPLPTAFLQWAAKKPLLKLSMPFFNSQLRFHLKRQAKTNYSSLRRTMGISSLPTSIIIRQEWFSIPSYTENTACLQGQNWVLLLCLHNSQMTAFRLAASSRIPALLFSIRLSPFTAVNGLTLPQKAVGEVRQPELCKQ